MRLRRLVVLALPVVSALFFVFFTAPAVANGQTATTTTLQVTPACLQSGCVTTLTATVTSGGTPVHPGLVVFCDKGLTDCQNEAPIGRAQLTSNGTATIRLGLSDGPHTLRAVFHGTETYGASASPTQNLTEVTNGLERASTFQPLNPNLVSGGITIGTYLTGSGPIEPTGTVSLVDLSRDNAAIDTSPLVVYNSTFGYVLTNPTGFSQIPLATLTSIVATATGDFNNDGFQDVAELTSNTNLLVFLGDGKGNFTQSPAYSSMTGAHGPLLAGDFNSDGKLDIAISDSATNKIYVSLGNGDGTFTPATPSALQDSSKTLYTGDFNHDGIPDLVSISNRTASGSSAQVLLGNGDGTFTAKTPLSFSGDTITSGAVADFNGDGFPDLAVAYFTAPVGQTVLAKQLMVFPGIGDGTFNSTPAASLPSYTGILLAGDFDDDGIPDLLSGGDQMLTFFKGHGNLTFTQSQPGYSRDSLDDMVAGDYTGSGKLQFAIVSTLNIIIYEVDVIPGIGEEVDYVTAANHQTRKGGDPAVGNAIADFNGDGLPDFAIFNPYTAPPEFQAFTSWFAQSTSGTIPLDSGVHDILATYSGDALHDSNSVAGTVRASGIAYLYPAGFTGDTSGLALNGSATLKGTTIQLTDGGQQEAGSFFSKKRLDLSGIFFTEFDFQLTNATGDGFAFVLQSNGPNAIGSAGAGIGYGNPPGASGPSITNSLAVVFDLHNNQGEGSNSIRLERNGVTSPDGAVDLTPSGIDLHSGHEFDGRVSSDGLGHITVSLQDFVTNQHFSTTFGVADDSINGELLHGSMGYAGFTGSTGANTAVQVIENWTVTLGQFVKSDPVYPPYPKPTFPDGFTGSTGIFYSGGAAVSGSAVQLTNGTPFKATSAFVVDKVLPQGFFTTDFDFQIANGVGDGFAFVLQNERLASVGMEGGGLGYGPDKPGGTGPSIPNSLAIKFDIHNNAGEVPNSTGLYLNGASPTTPFIDLTPYRINLQSGHTFHARIESNGTQLTLSVTDLNQYANFTTVLASGSTVESIIPQLAFAGFTGGTGATASSIKILNWTWSTH
jgi:hypothetical protein